MNPVHVCFPFTDPCPVDMARAMIASVRASMPGAIVVQLTDRTTAMIPGVDTALRLPKGEDFIVWRLQHMALAEYTKILWLDYDVIVQQDLRHVFAEHQFDCALTRRADNDPSVSADLARECPHNLGVAWSWANARGFWTLALNLYRERSRRDGWMDGQRAIESAIAQTSLRVISLPCSVYNYTPDDPREDLSMRHAVHYKGARKTWVIGRAALPEAFRTAARMSAA